MSDTTGLLVGLALLAGNAFFVGAEFAVMSARHSQVEPLVAAGRLGARTALWAMERVSLMLACAQLGITVCSIGLGAVAEPALAHLLEPPFAAVGLPGPLVHPVAFTLALGLVVVLHVVLGEMVPKNLAIAGPERAVLLLAPPLVVVAMLVRPVIGALNAVANGVLRAARVTPRDEVSSTFTADEVRSIVTESTSLGLLDDAQGLLAGSITLGARRARDVMVPWPRLVTVAGGATPQDVDELVARHGFSRFPVVGDADVAGYLHVKDLLHVDDEHYTEPVPSRRVRALASVRPDDEAEEVLATMQRSASHLARVVDDAGRTAGVVFLEDVLEELVGEVRDATQGLRTS